MAESKVTVEKLQEELEKEKSEKRKLQDGLFAITQEKNRLFGKVSELERKNQSLLEIIDNLSVALRDR